MAGMKEGPGSDPFADDESDEKSDVDTTEVTETNDIPSTEPRSVETTTTDIPYAVRRQTVKEDRNHELVIFARDEFQELEDDVRQAVADELGMSAGNVPVTDIREAYIEVARRNPDDMADVLLEWGYDHLR